jgi:Bacterial SH3 domain
MLKKNTTILLIFLLQSVLMVAQSSRFKDDETIHVWASSGLNMRSKPDAKAEKIATIPYGAKVVVLPNIGVKIPFEVEEFKGFVVKGYWLLVKYENTEGFVFDGFLSRLPAPNKSKNKSLLTYLEKEIGKIGDNYDIEIFDENAHKYRMAMKDEKLKEDDVVGFKQKIKQEIIYEIKPADGGSQYKITLSNSTFY